MKHLNREQRYAIFLMHKEKKSMRHIAKMINISVSTVSREIKRNSNNGKYSYLQAEENAKIRKERLKQPRKMCSQIKKRIEKYIRGDQLSPEQIVGLCKRKGYLMVSKSSIYNYIYEDKKKGGDLYKYCRFKLKHRKRPVGKYSPIKNRIGIEKRPIEADGTRFGDWEMDLIVGPNNKGAKLTLVERSTLFSIIKNLPFGKSSLEVAKTVVDALLPFKNTAALKTITTDNGPEFANHEYIKKHLGTTVYFADPYSSWQKGCIENTNMLYRQYIPCSSSFNNFSDKEILDIQHKLNRRPRKKIGFKLPYEEFYLSLQ